MQLSQGMAGVEGVRARLGAAACMLIAGSFAGAGAPVATASAAENEPADGARWQIDASVLGYAERGRTQVYEPIARITRLHESGRRWSAQVGLDAITGASANGALPSGRIQTFTTPSGHSVSSRAGRIPTVPFRDLRGSLDLAWTEPLTRLLTSTLGAHLSSEQDYLSIGASGSLAFEFNQRLSTLTIGGGYNRDTVMPTGGTPVGLSDAGTSVRDDAADGGAETDEDEDEVGKGHEPKRVKSGLIGISRILTRHWMLGVNAGRIVESGYLTEPYKVVTVYDPATGETIGSLREKRPSSRRRTDVMANSVYGFGEDVLYTSYRWYRDDWGIRSHTIDLKYRHELAGRRFLQPHLRWYTQQAADFFVHSLPSGASLPAYASGDYRLGPLRTATVGLGYGFRAAGVPGEFMIRGEWMRQWGEKNPPEAVGAQRSIELMPPLDIGSIVLGYTVRF